MLVREYNIDNRSYLALTTASMCCFR